MKSTKVILRIVFVSAITILVQQRGLAQTPTAAPTSGPGLVISYEGVSGDVDKKRREPVVSARVAAGPESATIYVDAYVVSDLTNYLPIQFDFFINRALYASQIRSTELPGPLGITVPYKTVPLPFTYSVVAKILHPNRTFTTVLNGSVEAIDPTPGPTLTPSAGLKCIYTESIDSETITYKASNVLFVETGSKLTTNFDAADSEDSSNTISIVVDSTESGSNLSGTLKVRDASGLNSTDVTGNFQKTEGTLNSVSLQSADAQTTLTCN